VLSKPPADCLENALRPPLSDDSVSQGCPGLPWLWILDAHRWYARSTPSTWFKQAEVDARKISSSSKKYYRPLGILGRIKLMCTSRLMGKKLKISSLRYQGTLNSIAFSKKFHTRTYFICSEILNMFQCLWVKDCPLVKIGQHLKKIKNISTIYLGKNWPLDFREFRSKKAPKRIIVKASRISATS